MYCSGIIKPAIYDYNDFNLRDLIKRRKLYYENVFFRSVLNLILSFSRILKFFAQICDNKLIIFNE